MELDSPFCQVGVRCPAISQTLLNVNSTYLVVQERIKDLLASAQTLTIGFVAAVKAKRLGVLYPHKGVLVRLRHDAEDLVAQRAGVSTCNRCQVHGCGATMCDRNHGHMLG